MPLVLGCDSSSYKGYLPATLNVLGDLVSYIGGFVGGLALVVVLAGFRVDPIEKNDEIALPL